jgi:CRP-like cAMP-binding protein
VLGETLSEFTELLKRSHLVMGIPDDQIEAIAALGERHEFGVGDRIVGIGENSGDLFLVLDGRVAAFSADRDRLYEVVANGVFGEIAFVDAGPRHCDFTCQCHTEVVRFPAKPLRTFLAGNRQQGFMFLANLARLMAARMRSADGRLDELLDLTHDVWEHAF